MPYHKNSERVEMVWPAKGVDRSTALAFQPDGTCVDAQNVRTYDLRNRQAGGKRSGLAAAFTNAATGSQRVTAIVPITQATGFNIDGTVTESVTVEASDLANADPLDLKDLDGIGGLVPDSTFQPRFEKQDSSPAVDTIRWNTSGSSSGEFALVFLHRVTNDVTVKLNALDTSTDAGNDKTAGEPTNFGPFIRGSNNYRTFIACRAEYQSADEVVFEILHYDNGTKTPIVQTASNVVLNGSSTRLADCTFRLYVDGDDVVATWTWSGAGSGGGNIDVELRATAADFLAQSVTNLAGNARAGLTTLDGTRAGDVDVTEFSYTRYVAANSPRVAHQLVAGQETGDGSGNRYYLPANWTVIRWDFSTSTKTEIVGEDSVANLNSAATGGGVWVDLTDNFIEIDKGTRQLNTIDYVILRRTVDDTDGQASVQVTPNWDDYAGSTGDTSTECGAAFLINDDDDGFLYIHLRWNNSASAPPTGGEQLAVEIGYYQSGTRNVIRNNSTDDDIVIAGTEEFEFRYEGNTLSVIINSRVAYEYTLTAGDLTNISFLDGNTKLGLFVYPFPTGSSTSAQYEYDRVRILNRSSSASAASSDLDLCVLTQAGSVNVGKLGGALEEVSGQGLTGAYANGFSFNGKVYVVDSEGARIIDVDSRTSDTWSGDGNLNPNAEMFAFATLYRGRAVLARSGTTPSLWYMSRQFDPSNFDTGATPEATAAVAGTLTSGNVVGAPQEPIVALIAWQDDYLLFGGANSISMLEGDPGYQGAIFPLTQGVGILGSRAWAFDDRDQLWFMGSSGLYRLPRGSREPVNVSGRRLATLLDQVSSTNTVIQLAYDAYKKTLHVFLTPVDGTTVGTHVVYDTFLDAFWTDQYPLAAGPWAVAPIRGNEDEDRRVVLGGDDGWVRRFLDSATGDLSEGGASSEAIDSYVKYGPLELKDGFTPSMVTEFHLTGAADNGEATLEFFTANTPEELEDTVFGNGNQFTVYGDSNAYQSPVRCRIRGAAHQIALRQNSSDSKWSMERLRLFVAPTGARRRRDR